MTDQQTSTTYRLDLPWPRPPLRSNGGHGNRYAKSRTVKEIRWAVFTLAKNAKIPTGQHLIVQLHYAPGRQSHIDAPNLFPTVKPCVDALANPKRQHRKAAPWVGLRLVPDDTAEYVTTPIPVIHYPPEPGPKCWLTVEVIR